VRGTDGGSAVEFLEPQVMVSVPERPELAPVAEEAARRIAAARAALVGGSTSGN
jgi:hypothetical protein